MYILASISLSILLISVEARWQTLEECTVSFEKIKSIDEFRQFHNSAREDGQQKYLGGCLKSYLPLEDLDSIERILYKGERESVCEKQLATKLINLDKQLARNSMGSKRSLLTGFVRLYISQVIYTCKRLLIASLDNGEKDKTLSEALIQINNLAQNFVWADGRIKSLVTFDRSKKPDPGTIILFNPTDVPNLRALSCVISSARKDFYEDSNRRPPQFDETDLQIYNVVTYDEFEDLKNEKRRPVLDVELNKEQHDGLISLKKNFCTTVEENFTGIVSIIKYMKILGHHLDEPEIEKRIRGSKYLNLWIRAGDICTALMLVQSNKQQANMYHLAMHKAASSSTRQRIQSQPKDTIKELNQGINLSASYHFDPTRSFDLLRSVLNPDWKYESFYSTFYTKNFLETLTHYLKMATAIDLAQRFELKQRNANDRCE